MKYILSLTALILVVLSSCSVKKKNDAAIKKVRNWSKENMHIPIYERPLPAAQVKNEIQGLTRAKAIEIALRNNRNFLAHLQEIGIASGQAVQAGFFSNPNIETLFRLPRHDADQTNIELNAQFTISDFWQVPLRKKVAEDELQVKTMATLTEMLELKKDVFHRFQKTLFAKIRYHLIAKSVAIFKSLKEHFKYRYQFGFTNKLELHLIEARYQAEKSRLLRQRGDLTAALASLQYLLGISEPEVCFDIDEIIVVPPVTISREQLLDYARANHPLLLEQNYLIKKAEHSISYERSRVVDNVQFGVAYERDFEKGNAGVGPLFSLDVPIFNLNYGEIEKAKHQKMQAHFMLQARQEQIETELSGTYLHYQSTIAALEKFQKRVIPELKQGVDYCQRMMDSMQLPATLLIDTQLEYIHAHEKLIDYLHEASDLYADLEAIVGTSLLS